ncbi:unnamed protein product [Citrullus colocynthis]|uniref:Uncharacterized protein n=1 Tax=Citrullus colocynthis TaxID=252529 RepID=A0ABP0YQG7_9ROSI
MPKFSDGFTCVDSFFASVAFGGAAASSATVGGSQLAGFDIGCFVIVGFLFSPSDTQHCHDNLLLR